MISESVRSFAKGFLGIVVLLVAGNLVEAQQRGQQGVRATEAQAPDRDGDGVAGSYDESTCPPFVNGAKAVPNPAFGDMDISDDTNSPSSDGLLDYFMGEWKFVQGSKDLIVQKWCINKPPNMQLMAFVDHFTYRILTSENGVNTERIKPDDEKT